VHRGLFLLGLVSPGRAELLLWEHVLGHPLEVIGLPFCPAARPPWRLTSRVFNKMILGIRLE
jgi:hypothetical protein